MLGIYTCQKACQLLFVIPLSCIRFHLPAIRTHAEDETFNSRDTISPAEQCDLEGVKLEEVHDFTHFFKFFLNLYQRSCDDVLLVMITKVGQIYTESST